MKTNSRGQRRKRNCRSLFKRQVLRQVDSSVLPANSVLGERATRSHHLVERSHAITRLEFPHFAPDAVHDARNVITRVCVVVRNKLGDLPVRKLDLVNE